MRFNQHQLTARTNPFTTGAKVAALAGLLSLAAHVPAFAAFVPLPEDTAEDPGASLGGGTGSFGGTVIAAQDTAFQTQTTFAGLLRTLVVDTGSGYDFYYQLVNTGTDDGFGADIFRIKTVGGFNGLTLSVTYRTDLATLDFAGFASGPAGGAGAYEAGTKPLFSADRDVGSAGSAGFDFSSSRFLVDPDNINPGEKSMFAVVRTNATTYFAATMEIDGFDSTRVASFVAVAVPEPGAAGLLALGSALLLRRRR